MRWVSYTGTTRAHIGLLDGDTIRTIDGVPNVLSLLGDDGENMRDAAEAAHRQPTEVVAPHRCPTARTSRLPIDP